MSKINDGGPAYPTLTEYQTAVGTRGHDTTPGMSLRDAAALAALPALIARHRADVPWEQIAPRAFGIADAFIAARTKGGGADG